MKFLSSIESWKSFFEWSSVVLVAGTVIAGAGAVITGRVTNERQKVVLRGLDKGILEARRDLEAERIKRLELEAKIAPRRLSGDQKSSLVKAFSGDPGAIVVVSSMDDSDSADFADDFESALRSAHWDTVRSTNHLTREYGVLVGTYIGTKPNSGAAADAKQIKEALESIGVAYREKTFDETDEKTVTPYFQLGCAYLVIGHKPPIATSEQSKTN
jgi:hypothetical protein